MRTIRTLAALAAIALTLGAAQACKGRKPAGTPNVVTGDAVLGITIDELLATQTFQNAKYDGTVAVIWPEKVDDIIKDEALLTPVDCIAAMTGEGQVVKVIEVMSIGAPEELARGVLADCSTIKDAFCERYGEGKDVVLPEALMNAIEPGKELALMRWLKDDMSVWLLFARDAEGKYYWKILYKLEK